MINNKVKTLLFIFLILFCIAAVNAEKIDDNIDTISNVDIIDVKSENYIATIDDAETVENFSALNNAISSHSGSEELILNNSYTYNNDTDNSLKDGITISKDITINGNGHAIDGNYTARIFKITGSYSLTLKNIRLINGNATDYGGAIYNSCNNNNIGNITLINSTFTNNNVISSDSSASGGAIYSTGNIIVNDSTFTNNNANVNSSNYRSNACGGAIYSSGNVIINNSTFTNNNAIMNGSNSRYAYGGAIYVNREIIVVNSIFSNNSAINASNLSYGYGGAIYSYYGNLNITNSTFDNNYAAGDGGAVRLENKGKSSIINSTFNNNIALADGGAVHVHGNITVINTKFNNNSAIITAGGALVGLEGITTIINSTFINNSGVYGGAIHSEQSFLNVTNSIFINNNATDGGAIIGLNSMTITESTFIGNNATSGGAISITNGNLTIIMSKFDDNTATNGGAIYSGMLTGTLSHSTPGVNIIVYDSEFVSNYATNGGAIYYLGMNGFIDTYMETILKQLEDPEVYDKVMEDLKEKNMTLDEYLKEYREELIEEVYEYMPYALNSSLTVMNSNFDNNNGTLGDDIYTTDNTIVHNNNYTKNSFANIYVKSAIINGTIISVLENNTYYVISGTKFKVNATAFVDGASIAGYDLIITDGIHSYNATYIGYGTYEITGEIIADFMINHYSAIINSTNITNTMNNYSVENGTVINNKNITIEVTLDEAIAGENITGNITLKDANGDIANITGEVTVEIDGKNYTVAIVNGTGKLNIEDEFGPGNYTININFEGNDYFNPANTTANFTIIDTGVILIVHDLTKYYGNGSKFIIMLTDSKGNPIADQIINITINGVTYTRVTDENGTIMMSINLIAGVYNATVSYGDLIQNATITVLPTIEAEDLIKYFKNGTQYYAKFYNLDGTPLANTNVTFNIHGVFYTRTTNEEGISKLNINLNPGEYIITAYNPVNNESKANVITVLTTIFGEKVVKYYRNGTQYYAYVLDENGNPLANANVTFNIHGVFYNRTTDEDGIVKLNINLNPGEYIITAWNLWNGEATSNNITVHNVVQTKDLEMTTAERKPFKVTILGDHGAPLANAKVVFNIHGVFYEKTTDANGQVSLDINLIAGKYIITTYYNEYSISNTIVVK